MLTLYCANAFAYGFLLDRFLLFPVAPFCEIFFFNKNICCSIYAHETTPRNLQNVHFVFCLSQSAHNLDNKKHFGTVHFFYSFVRIHTQTVNESGEWATRWNCFYKYLYWSWIFISFVCMWLDYMADTQSPFLMAK